MTEQVCSNCGRPLRNDDRTCKYCGFVAPSPDLILSPGTTLRGRYEIQELIHTGGMGYVYLARDKTLFDRSCVIKQVTEEIRSEGHRRKLEEEALEMARLTHPSIAMILDQFVELNYYFLVMELIHGKTLNQVSKERRGQLNEDEVVKWAISICDVVNYIHNQGIVHRDISPDNIMLTEEGNIKFIDFGTLRELRYAAAQKTAGMGKYGYTPPEQWEGKPGPQSDIFALGATLYYLLTGFLPLSKSYMTGQGPLKEDLCPMFPPIRSRNPDVSSRLEAILQKALQLDANNRYSSVMEMREDFSSVRQRPTPSNAVSPVTVTLPQQEAKPAQLPSKLLETAAEQKVSEKDQSSSRRKVSKRARRRAARKLTEATIKRKTASDTLQHPATLLPAAVCTVSAIYLVLLSPIFGGAVGAAVLTGISGAAAAGSYLSRYGKVYLKNTRELMDILDAERVQMEEEELEQLRETLRSGFLLINSTKGNSVLDELTGEFAELQTTLGQHRVTDPISMSVIPALAGETYRRGLSVLSDALDLMNVVHTPGKDRLEREIAGMEREVEVLRHDRGEEERLKLKKEILASLKERMGALSRLQLYVEQLLYQAQRCEASLHATRIELATIRAGSTKTSVDSVVEALQERIKQAKEVQDELTKMGY